MSRKKTVIGKNLWTMYNLEVAKYYLFSYRDELVTLLGLK